MENIFPIFNQIADRNAKESILKQRGAAIWLVGLSGAGKSTIATALEKKLLASGHFTVLLDGDNMRHGLNSNLGFSAADRQENIRRVAEVTKLLVNNGIVTVCSFITPSFEMRQNARQIVGENDFVEVFVNCPFEICEERDVKGLYKKAKNGDIKNFTGLG
ncbi:MAG: adenylyl-sulfate kinase, partial [Sphingobacteriales bacterium]